MSVPGLLRQAARERPDAVFLREAESGRLRSAARRPGTLTLRELDEHVDRLAAGLAVRGVGAGDRVAVALPNGAAWIGLLFATTRLGAVLVTLNVRYRGGELEHMLADSGARLVATDTDLTALYAELRPRLPDLEHVVVLAAERLANYKVPRVVEFVDDLPLTPAGKIQKAVLRQRVQKGS